MCHTICVFMRPSPVIKKRCHLFNCFYLTFIYPGKMFENQFLIANMTECFTLNLKKKKKKKKKNNESESSVV